MQGVSVATTDEGINGAIEGLTIYMGLLDQYPEFAKAEETTTEGYFPDLHIGETREEIYAMAERLKARQ